VALISTHLHTNGTQNDTKQKKYIEQHKNLGRVCHVRTLMYHYNATFLYSWNKILSINPFSKTRIVTQEVTSGKVTSLENFIHILTRNLFKTGTFNIYIYIKVKVKVKQSRYRPGVAQRVLGS
jgi:hypothetical protein